MKDFESTIMKSYTNGLGHITKMAATPIHGKNPSKIVFSRTSEPIAMKLGNVASEMQANRSLFK